MINKCYISGRISGEPREIYSAKFKRAEEFLKELGYETLNPVDLFNDEFNGSWDLAMRVCLAELVSKCNCIFMLKDWKKSSGARLEYIIAKSLGMDVIYETNSFYLYLN